MESNVDQELLFNEFAHFFDCLRIVLGDATYQSEVMGARTSDCAWELKSDLVEHCSFIVRNGSNWVNEAVLNDIDQLQGELEKIDTDNESGMNSFEWVNLKESISKFVSRNKSLIREVYSYFDMKQEWFVEF